ncbi:amidohydrolase [Fusibacter sp. 3D3]|uniref:amidohydrolase n=1 Tax=Fusibacter sp. 3D3 TaxID=1048380 RepID=UPI0008530568|nr:amidohydrolase [Fusibacter sp. 3D3]GAU76449.1 N-acyl-L-amino acid amidohydrolase [Fusibacter sp. 3D3]
MKELLVTAIEKHKAEIIDIGNTIFRNPELGFKEFGTAEKMTAYLNQIGIEVENEISVTGLRGMLGKAGINICLIAEMDAIPTFGHPFASKDQHAAHACAHSNQVAIMLGVMKAIAETGMLEKTGGRITIIGTPAEEFTDLEYRKTLVKAGQISYYSGKQDMISKGIFDDVDLVISCHSMGGVEGQKADVNATLNGFISKQIIYHGQTAHAGAQPHLGINALNAATIGLSAVNAQRETFHESYKIRVHAIIKEGGETVNSIPGKVVLEAMVRGNSLEALVEANYKVNRAFDAGAYAVGATCEIIDAVGFLPFHQCADLSAVVKQNLGTLIGEENIIDGFESTASGDIGDLSAILPTIQFGFSGFSGNIHGPNFCVVDEEMAYITPAKAIVMTLYDLLCDDAALARKIIEDNPPSDTKAGYVERWLKNGLLDMKLKSSLK